MPVGDVDVEAVGDAGGSCELPLVSAVSRAVVRRDLVLLAGDDESTASTPSLIEVSGNRAEGVRTGGAVRDERFPVLNEF